MLKPWREVITPHPDVAAGRYQQAEFAADLAQVLQGQAEPEYQDPTEFFARTYLTEGMQRLLIAALERLSGQGGEPVVQLKTAFGGGKTHTMLALFHLLNRQAQTDQMTGVPDLLRAAKVRSLPLARTAVLVGTALNPSRPRQVQGLTVHTLWGDLAAQLGQEPAYKLIASADQQGVAPGADDLVDLFDRFGPSVVLIDELVAYARNLYGVSGLPAGSFDSNMTFVQALTEAAKRSQRSLVVAAIPESDLEIGGPGGRSALDRIEHTFGRLEAIWKPVGALEGFEIVRRRLFSPVKDEAARDAVARAFVRLYDDNPADFPSECREGTYLDRLRMAYPIHPELFDRLYNDWSSLERFQRTRGVLRLMAATIHELWVRDDRSLLLAPGNLPLDAPQVRDELLRYLPEGWNAVLDRDVDGAQAEPRAIDQSNPRYGEFLAARRVARTIFLGSAPHVRQQTVRGIEDVRVRLGVVQPGEPVAVFNDALSRLRERLTHLYSDTRRYWYDTQPNLRRTMEDRAGKLEAAEVEAEMLRRLRQIRERGDFKAVHVGPASSDVPDEPEARLVILSPTTPHRAHRAESPAVIAATGILDQRGNSPRLHRNMLLFVAADLDQISGVEEETRRYLAWKSIGEDADALNLDAHQRREATRGQERSDETVNHRLNEAYCWLLVPTQEGTEPMIWDATRIPGGQENPVAKAVKKVRGDAQLLTEWDPQLLKMELDRWLWQDQPHISLKRVWEYLTTYLYLSRLRDEGVLLATVRAGLQSQQYFAYARSVGPDGRYQGLQFGSSSGSILLDDQSLLVQPNVAARHMEVDVAATPKTGDTSYPQPKPGQGTKTVQNGGKTGTTETEVPTSSLPNRFYGSVSLDPMRVERDVGQIVTEVLQHLTSLLGAEVEVTLEIQGHFPEGFPDQVVRTVTENCRTLKFTTQGFEAE